jgi:hypothetical protein
MIGENNMGAMKTICTEIEESIDAGVEIWEAVTDAIIRWEIDPASDFAKQLEDMYLLPEDTPTVASQDLH